MNRMIQSVAIMVLTIVGSGVVCAQEEGDQMVNKVVTVPEPQVLEIVDRPFPKLKPGSGSVVVKSEVTALCVDDKMWLAHDHEWFSHPVYGMGHEGVGTVVDAGTSTKLKVGDRVLISHGGYCGRCYSCENYLCQAMCKGIAGGRSRNEYSPAPVFY